MSDEESTDPVIGDGVVTIPGPDNPETKKMAVDLSENVANMLMTETAANVQNTNLSGRNIANICMGSLQAGVARRHNEIDVDEARAQGAVLATPIASPTTQSSSS